MVGFDTGFGSYDIHILTSYLYIIQMMCFNPVFSDAPSGGYGIYVVLHIVHGQTYAKVA